MPSSACGFSALDMSPGSSPTATARTARRRILAERVLGSASTSTTRGGLNGRPSSRATSSASSLASSPSAPAGAGATTKHQTASPLVSSGTPTTAASLTASWPTSTDSTSAGPRRLPATLIVSSERPSRNQSPSSSISAQSPWRQTPGYIDQY